MGDPVSAIVGAVTGLVTSVFQGQPDIPAPQPAVKPPESQAAKIPDQQQRSSQGAASQAGPVGAPSGTMLTGPGGVTNSMLNLGKNTLLGQ